MSYRRINDREIEEVFTAARELSKNDAVSKTSIVSLAEKAALKVLNYYASDPTAPNLILERKNHRAIMARLIGETFEGMLIKEGLT